MKTHLSVMKLPRGGTADDLARDSADYEPMPTLGGRGLHSIALNGRVTYEGESFDWPVLYLIRKSAVGATYLTRVTVLDDYFYSYESRSKQWRTMLIRVFRLLIDFAVAAWDELQDPHRRFALIRRFVRALLFGTIQKNGLDPLGLYWRPKGRRETNVLLKRLTHFFASVTDMPQQWADAASVQVALKDPLTAMAMAAELSIRQRTRLLSQIKAKARTAPHGFTGIVGKQASNTGFVKSFPRDHVVDFLYNGFRDGDETCELIAWLLFSGGMRSSEPFHLFVTDVQWIRSDPVLYFHHPEEGKIIYGNRPINRLEFLQRNGLLPRTMEDGRLFAGWKGMLGDNHGAQVHWLPVEPMVARLRFLLQRYIVRVRPAIMARRPRSLPDHPFLFVASGIAAEQAGGNIGDPYALSAFRSSWELTVNRYSNSIGNPNVAHGRGLGTTPQGTRHHYGRFLKTLGIEPNIIRQCLHHKSIESQAVYTSFSPDEINKILSSAAADPNGSTRSVTLSEMRSAFEDAFKAKSIGR